MKEKQVSTVGDGGLKIEVLPSASEPRNDAENDGDNYGRYDEKKKEEINPACLSSDSQHLGKEKRQADDLTTSDENDSKRQRTKSN